MSDRAEVKILQAGVGSAMTGAFAIFGANISKFAIGDAFGFEISGTESNPLGNLTYTGGLDAIQLKSFDGGRSAKISMVIPESTDGVLVGNIMLYVLDDFVHVPFALIVLPELIIKQNVSSDIIDQGFVYPGTRMVIGLTVKYVDAQDLEGLTFNITVESPEYAQLPYFGSSEDVPNSIANPWSQFVVNELAPDAGSPGLVVKDESGLYYATPLFQNLDSPKFGVLDFGSVDTGRVTWVWGGLLTYPNEFYKGVIGGASLTDTNVTITVGGQPL